MKKINYKIAFIISFCLLIVMSFLFILSLKEQKALLSYHDKYILDLEREETLQKSLALNTHRNIQSANNEGKTVLITNTLCKQDLEALNQGYSVFFWALIGNSNNKIKQVRSLIDCGANPNIQDNDGDTPLHYLTTIESHEKEIIRFLLHVGADPNIQNRWGNIPLHRAAGKGYVDVAEILLIAGADPNIQNRWDNTPLHYAVRSGHVDMVEIFLTAKADPNIKNNSGNTPLHQSTYLEFIDIAKILLDAGADPNVQNIRDFTPLHYVAQEGFIDIAEILLDAGADINVQSVWVGAPLHRAAIEGHVDMVRFLLNAGADPLIASGGIFHKQTPKDVATPEVLKLFEERGIKDLNYFQKLVR